MAKKSVKKSAKKSPKKAAPKVAKKAPKKPAPKSAKKVTKKVTKKAPAKVVKKATPKAAPAKAGPKPVAKKPLSKATTKSAAKSAPKPAAPAPAAASGLPAVGSPAPAFTLQSSVGRTISLADYADKTFVLYVYPRADTPGCTIQACGFRDAIASYGNLSVDVLGLSPDPLADVSKFAAKFNLNFPLLADPDHTACAAYGTWVQKSMYGKTYMGASRTTFIIKNGTIAHVFEKVKPEGHEAEVLKALDNL